MHLLVEERAEGQSGLLTSLGLEQMTGIEPRILSLGNRRHDAADDTPIGSCATTPTVTDLEEPQVAIGEPTAREVLLKVRDSAGTGRSVDRRRHTWKRISCRTTGDS